MTPLQLLLLIPRKSLPEKTRVPAQLRVSLGQAGVLNIRIFFMEKINYCC